MTYLKKREGVTRTLDFPKYRDLFYATKLDNVEPREVVHSYLDGMKWVLLYYTQGCPTIEWMYRYHYPPFVCDVLEHLQEWPEPSFVKVESHVPFEQLIGVLPPSSFHLLPRPFETLLRREELQEYFSTQVQIDFE